ncbi:MAG: carboxypeptidase regulatory-like domain-containing protein [Candidatus Tectomicrobia bacterium]|nr:carboxypeptidase regulatory-like domain-containing protein [Candidatus Tectomicrobia bacterium]
METLLEGVNLAGIPTLLAVSGAVLAAARGNNLDLFDMASPAGVTQPSATIQLAAEVRAVVAAGSVFYLSSGTALTAVGIGNPAAPTTTTVVQNLSANVQHLKFVDDFLVAGIGQVATFYDATNRTSLTKVREVSHPSTIGGLEVGSGRAYVLSGNRLSVFGLTAAGSGAAGETPPPAPTGALAGTITAGATNAPVQGAVVTLPEAGVATRTDAAGSFRFSDLSPGTVSLSVAASGFEVGQASGLTISADATTTRNLQLTELRRSGGISGTVRARDGAAVAGASVRIPGASFSAASDSAGAYSIAGLSPGTVELTVNAPGYREATVRGVEIRADATVTADATLEPLPATLRGTVVQARSGEALAGALVRSADGAIEVRTDELGAFQLSDLAVGTLRLEISATGFRTVEQEVTTSRGEVRELSVELAPEISGPLRILSAGFADSPTSFSAEEGGEVTMRAEVGGGGGGIEIEAVYRPSDITDPTGEVPLGRFSPRDEQTYELIISDLPPRTLPAGEFGGIVFVARDAEGATATWPALNVPVALPAAAPAD